MKITLPLFAVALFGLAACDQTATAPDAASTEAAATSGTPQPAGLSGDEVTIWNSLSEPAKAQAAEFIANGGTLTQFVAI